MFIIEASAAPFQKETIELKLLNYCFISVFRIIN